MAWLTWAADPNEERGSERVYCQDRANRGHDLGYLATVPPQVLKRPPTVRVEWASRPLHQLRSLRQEPKPQRDQRGEARPKDHPNYQHEWFRPFEQNIVVLGGGVNELSVTYRGIATVMEAQADLVRKEAKVEPRIVLVTGKPGLV
jgi:hypothetical protein